MALPYTACGYALYTCIQEGEGLYMLCEGHTGPLLLARDSDLEGDDKGHSRRKLDLGILYDALGVMATSTLRYVEVYIGART